MKQSSKSQDKVSKVISKARLRENQSEEKQIGEKENRPILDNIS